MEIFDPCNLDVDELLALDADALCSLDDARLSALSDHFAERSTESFLHWTAARFGERAAFGTGFGIEGCVLIHLIAEHAVSIDLFTLDTGLFFPETYALWQRLEARYGIKIRAQKPELSLEAQAVEHGAALWERLPDTCCSIRKVKPLAQALSGKSAWLSAIRGDQTSARGEARALQRDTRFSVLKLSPLLKWTADAIWVYARKHNIPYNPLHEQGYPSIGCQPCTTAVAAGEDPRSGRWRGQEKTECGLHGRFVGPK